MPRINPLDPSQSTGKAKELLDGVQKKLGMTPNLLSTMAHAPAALEAYLGLGASLGGGRLGAALREQIALAVAGANACDYCASAHTAVAKSLKVDTSEIESNLAGASNDPRVGAGLRFARRIVDERGWVSDDDLSSIRAAGYDDGEISEIIANVALNIFTNYFNHIAGTNIDFPRVEVPTSARSPHLASVA